MLAHLKAVDLDSSSILDIHSRQLDFLSLPIKLSTTNGLALWLFSLTRAKQEPRFAKRKGFFIFRRPHPSFNWPYES
ncbi:hypothetical protein KEM48_005620 [Puccinia striiformis f. sp. tritici PST-130]|nr:hypothetical protein KEM48_005620 [Puccinia striiformis f. sp. tritici PST-130]